MNISGIIKFLYPSAKLDENYSLRDDSDGNGVYVDKWTLPDPKPSMQSIFDAEPAYLASVATQKGLRRGRKTAVLAKLGLQASDVPGLIELIQDRNAD